MSKFFRVGAYSTLLIVLLLLCFRAEAIVGPSISLTTVPLLSNERDASGGSSGSGNAILNPDNGQAIINPDNSQEIVVPGNVLLTLRLGDPDSNDLIVDPDSGDYILQEGLTPVDAPLSHRPPTVVDPTIVTIEEDPSDPTKNRITYSRSPYTSPTTSSTAKTSATTVALTNLEDAEIYLPCDDQIEIAQLLVDEGKNVKLIGGSMKANTAATSSIRALLRAQGTAGHFYAEGLLLDADNVEGVDAISFGASASYTNQRAHYTYQNIYIKNTALKTEPYHSDGMQQYGPTKTIWIDKVTIRAGATGMFVDPQHIHYALDLRRIDMDYTFPTAWGDPRGETSQIFYIHANVPDDLDLRRRPPFGLDNIYAGRRETYYGISSDGYWGSFSLNPGQGASYGWDLDVPDPASSYATINASFPEISGRVIRGLPPAPFVNESEVGLNYVPPGYKGD